MVANAINEPSSQDSGTTDKSKFTYRDLRLLAQYSTECPLRVIALIDFDCFYAQCERVRLGLPEGRPLGVQQFKHVIATNYEARAAGLKKVITAVEARRLCPEIILQHVPTWREGDTTWRYRDDAIDHMSQDKSSLDYYRLQSRRAIELVKKSLPDTPLQKVEKASIDEIFVDLSAQVHAVLLERFADLLIRSDAPLDSKLPRPWTELLDWKDDKLVETQADPDEPEATDWDDVAIHIGAEIVRMLRREIYEHLHYTCSAGIARNKVVAKLAAGHNKPNKQTVIRNSAILPFLKGYKFTKLRGLGGKLGQQVSRSFATEQLSDLLKISLKEMEVKLGTASAPWVYRVIRGCEYSEVTPRTQIQSMLAAKTFDPGIKNLDQAEKWLQIFAADIVGRLEEQEGRRPRTMSVHHQANGRFGPTKSKQAQIPPALKIDAPSLARLFRDTLTAIASDAGSWPCWTLSVGVSDFVETERASHSISAMFTLQGASTSVPSESGNNSVSDRDHQPLTKHQKRPMFDLHAAAAQDTVERSMDHQPHKHDRSESNAKRVRQLDFKADQAPLRHADETKYQCPTCSKLVEPENVLEHLDWHVAMELQNAD